MGGSKRLHLRGIGFAGRRVRLRCEQLCIERLRGHDREHRDVDHPGAPFLGARGEKAKGETADRIGLVRYERHPACERDPAHHRHFARREECGLRQRRRLPVALEPAGRADAFRVVATEAGMAAIHLFEGRDNPLLRQPTRRQPAAGIGERCCHAQHHDADHAKPHHHRGRAQLSPGARRIAHIVWHFSAPSDTSRLTCCSSASPVTWRRPPRCGGCGSTCRTVALRFADACVTRCIVLLRMVR